jgi:hypothetical protein
MIGMADETEFTQEQVDDGERDALALAAAFVRGDLDAVHAVSRNADAGLVITRLLNLLFRSLRERRTDPAAWIERRQARLRKAAGNGS